MALFSRSKDPAQLTEQEKHEASVRESVESLRQEVDAFTNRVRERSKAVKKTEKETDRQVADAKKRLAGARQIPQVAFAGQIKVFEDRVQTPEGTYPLDERATFAVDSAGNMAVTRRHTLTRAVMLGPFSVFTPKATKHDDRELYFIAEHPEWVFVSQLNPDAGPGARQAAAAANLAARQAQANRQARQRSINKAEEELRHAQDAAPLTRKKVARELAGAYQSFDRVDAVATRVRGQLEACEDQNARAAKRARKVLAQVSMLTPTEEQRQLPAAPASRQISAPSAGEEVPQESPEPPPTVFTPSSPAQSASNPAPPPRDAPTDSDDQDAVADPDQANHEQTETGVQATDLVAQLEKLASLHQSGAISDDEFAALKAKLIAS